MNYNEMIVERNISVQSNCEHHFVVIDGLATVAYVPNKNVLGLSKLIELLNISQKDHKFKSDSLSKFIMRYLLF